MVGAFFAFITKGVSRSGDNASKKCMDYFSRHTRFEFCITQ